MVVITVEEILEMYNNDGLSLRDIGDKIGKSKSSVQRMLNNDGFFYDKDSKKYLKKEDVVKINSDPINFENVKPKSKVKRSDELSYTSFGIENDIYRALKIKCAVENINLADVVNNALKEFIEKKYFDMF